MNMRDIVGTPESDPDSVRDRLTALIEAVTPETLKSILEMTAQDSPSFERLTLTEDTLPPLEVASTAQVDNLNAEFLGGVSLSQFLFGENETGAMAVTDANQAIKAGAYIVNSPYTNTPTSDAALILTIPNTAGNRIGQFGVPTGGIARLSYRVYTGTWSSWRPVAAIVSGSVHVSGPSTGGIFNALAPFIPNTDDTMGIRGGYFNGTHSFVISRAARTNSTTIQLNVVRSDRTLQQINLTASTVHTGEGWSISW